MTGRQRAGRPDTLQVDRFDVANASFWLDMVACWLDDPAHASQLAADLWDNTVDAGEPLTVIVRRSAGALRAALTADTDTSLDLR
ncbi:hypothetical protein [uncultured Friedmanniella sp.]|uniref:hypothetical protein n=1 Tax=uncultured Friedmanniella sp. TaxID=335381 RepID=UPI0035CAE85C